VEAISIRLVSSSLAVAPMKAGGSARRGRAKRKNQGLECRDGASTNGPCSFIPTGGSHPMNIDELKSVANAIVAPQKGVLAADESNPTIKKRFDSVQVESSEENRRRYREILFTADGIERYVGGVILYDETLRQGTRDGVPFPRLLADRGIIPGIKVDQGAKALALHPG